MKKLLLISTAVLGLTITYSCKKNNTGGDASILVNVQRDNNPVKRPVLYVSFGAKETSSSVQKNYDLRITGDSLTSSVRLDGLRYGKYYIFAMGFDSILMKPVQGGVIAKIKWKERDIKEMPFTIQVAE